MIIWKMPSVTCTLLPFERSVILNSFYPKQPGDFVWRHDACKKSKSKLSDGTKLSIKATITRQQNTILFRATGFSWSQGDYITGWWTTSHTISLNRGQLSEQWSVGQLQKITLQLQSNKFNLFMWSNAKSTLWPCNSTGQILCAFVLKIQNNEASLCND